MPVKRLILPILVSAPLLISAAFAAADAGSNPESPMPEAIIGVPAQELTPAILQQFLLAEIAQGRGQTAVAARIYTDLAKSTRDPRIARRAAVIAYYSRDTGLSIEAARIWSELEPDSVDAKQAYWVQLADKGSADQLADSMASVVSASESSRQGIVLMQLGRFMSRVNDRDVAARVVDSMTGKFLSLPEAHFVRAMTAFSANQKEKAATELDIVLTQKPDWEPAVILKAQLLIANPQQAIDTLAEYVKQHPHAHEVRLAYARALIESKHYDEARAEFGTLLGEEPERAELLYSMGLLLLQAGDPAGAEKHLKAALEKDSSDADSIHYYLGQIAEDSGRTTEAIDHYDAVTPMGRHQPDTQLRAAAVLARGGQLQSALDRLHAAEAAYPKNLSSLLTLEAQLLGENGRKEEAFQLMADAVKKNPDDPTLLYESALFAERIGKSDIVESNLRKVIKLKPDYAHAYNALGYSLADRSKNLDEANALIDKALALAPNDAAIMDSKGWVSYRRGDLQGAVDILQKALTVMPDPEIAAHLGEVLWRMGREDDARKTWNDALQAAPENEALNTVIKRFVH